MLRPSPGMGDRWITGPFIASLISGRRSGRRCRRRRSVQAAPWPSRQRFDGDQLQLREAGDIFRRCLRGIPGAVEVLEGDGLAFGAVEVVQVSLGQLALVVIGDVRIHDGDRRFGQNADRGDHDVELIVAQLLQREVGLVLPGQQHVADAVLREGGGRAARGVVQHGDVLVERAHEFLRVLAVLLGPGPGGQVVPARAAARLGVRRDDLHTLGHQVAPVLDALGLPSRTRNTIVEV